MNVRLEHTTVTLPVANARTRREALLANASLVIGAMELSVKVSCAYVIVSYLPVVDISTLSSSTRSECYTIIIWMRGLKSLSHCTYNYIEKPIVRSNEPLQGQLIMRYQICFRSVHHASPFILLLFRGTGSFYSSTSCMLHLLYYYYSEEQVLSTLAISLFFSIGWGGNWE